MVLMNPKPTSAGRRSMIKVVSPELYKGKPHESLLEKKINPLDEIIMAE